MRDVSYAPVLQANEILSQSTDDGEILKSAMFEAYARTQVNFEKLTDREKEQKLESAMRVEYLLFLVCTIKRLRLQS